MKNILIRLTIKWIKIERYFENNRIELRKIEDELLKQA